MIIQFCYLHLSHARTKREIINTMYFFLPCSWLNTPHTFYILFPVFFFIVKSISFVPSIQFCNNFPLANHDSTRKKRKEHWWIDNPINREIDVEKMIVCRAREKKNESWNQFTQRKTPRILPLSLGSQMTKEISNKGFISKTLVLEREREKKSVFFNSIWLIFYCEM